MNRMYKPYARGRERERKRRRRSESINLYEMCANNILMKVQMAKKCANRRKNVFNMDSRACASVLHCALCLQWLCKWHWWLFFITWRWHIGCDSVHEHGHGFLLSHTHNKRARAQCIYSIDPSKNTFGQALQSDKTGWANVERKNWRWKKKNNRSIWFACNKVNINGIIRVWP